MPQPDNTPSVSLQLIPPEGHTFATGCKFITASLIPLRGPSGKLYGELDTSTGIIIFRRGKLPAERIDLTPYFKAAKGEK